MRYLESPDTPLDILETEKSQISGLVTQLILHLIMNGPGNHDAAWAGEFLRAGCNIDAVSVDIVTFGDDFADIHRHPQQQSVVGIRRRLGQMVLRAEREADRVSRVLELEKQAVARTFYDLAATGDNARLDNACSHRHPALMCAGFIAPHKPGVA